MADEDFKRNADLQVFLLETQAEEEPPAKGQTQPLAENLEARRLFEVDQKLVGRRLACAFAPVKPWLATACGEAPDL